MALATHSAEAQITRQLEELGCSSNAFAEISGVVARTRMAQGLAGQKDFEQTDAERMLAVLAEMTELRDLSQSPVDWKQVDEIRKALEERRAAKKLIREAQEHLEAWNNFMREKYGNNYRT